MNWIWKLLTFFFTIIIIWTVSSIWIQVKVKSEGIKKNLDIHSQNYLSNISNVGIDEVWKIDIKKIMWENEKLTKEIVEQTKGMAGWEMIEKLAKDIQK